MRIPATQTALRLKFTSPIIRLPMINATITLVLRSDETIETSASGSANAVKYAMSAASNRGLIQRMEHRNSNGLGGLDDRCESRHHSDAIGSITGTKYTLNHA